MITFTRMMEARKMSLSKSLAVLALMSMISTPALMAADSTATPSIWPAAASPGAITDAKVEAEIDALIARMTVAQKVGQLIQADISAIKPKDLARYPLG